MNRLAERLEKAGVATSKDAVKRTVITSPSSTT